MFTSTAANGVMFEENASLVTAFKAPLA